MGNNKKSEIYGSGYGDKHIWRRGDTEQVNGFFGYTGGTKSTYYQCSECGEGFRHNYDNFGETDIFEAMKFRNVSEECKDVEIAKLG